MNDLDTQDAVARLLPTRKGHFFLESMTDAIDWNCS